MDRDAKWWRYYYAIQEILDGDKGYRSTINNEQEGIGDLKPFSKLPTQLLRDANICTQIHFGAVIEDCGVYVNFIKHNERIKRMDDDEN